MASRPSKTKKCDDCGKPVVALGKCNTHYEKTRRARDPEYQRKRTKRAHLRNYGLTEPDFLKILENQDYECKICHNPIDMSAAIDHNHSCCEKRPTCGECNRGLLCNTCNLGLGQFKDSILYLEAAIRYLKETS